MTDMEKKVMVRLCAKIVAETDLYVRWYNKVVTPNRK